MRVSPVGEVIPKFGSAVRIGMGCASLGSRIGAAASARALIAAHEAGVNWYDVAPAYGLGEAEILLGGFLDGRRETVRVTTKVGIGPPERLRLMKLIYALGRPALGLVSGLRGAFRSIKATRNGHLPLDPGLIEASLSRSLKRLRTDYVDVFALHDPLPEHVLREDILRVLERVVARGQARAIAVAGTAEACRAALDAPRIYDVLQMSVAHFREDRARFGSSGKTIVLHSVFGVDGALDQVGKQEPRAVAAERLLSEALTENPHGIVLASMASAAHLEANLAVARAVDRPQRDEAPWRATA